MTVETPYNEIQINKAMADVLQRIYPEIFESTHIIESKIDDVQSLGFDLGYLKIMLDTIQNSISEMRSKEKVIVFPFLLKLVQQNRKSLTNHAFKNIEQSYSFLSVRINEMREHLAYISNGDDQVYWTDLMVHLNNLDDKFHSLQKYKEIEIFGRFRTLNQHNAV